MKLNSDIETLLHETGERFKLARIHAQLSQEELAYESGVALRTISRLENGHSVSSESWVRVLKALGLADRLSLLVPPPPEISPVEQLTQKKKKTRQRVRPNNKKTAPSHSKTAPWRGFETPGHFDEES